MWFTRLSIGNPVLATMMMMALLVLGLFSWRNLKVDQFPDIDFPTLVVQLDYPGASPQIIETSITRKVEEALNTIAGISQIYSRSYEGSSVVIVQFNLDTSSRTAAEDVREKLSLLKPLLPEEASDARVLRFDPASRPILSLVLSSPKGTASAVEMSTYADQVLRKRLENARGVGSVNLVGDTQREINVYLHPPAMQALGISADQVLRAVRQENQDFPAGNVRTLEEDRVVQINARLKTVDDFRALIISGRGGQNVRLSQVADVVDGPKELESLALLNGQRSLAIEVLKTQGENTIEVVNGLKAVVDQLQTQLPQGMALQILRDNSRPIQVAVSGVQETLIEGAFLTVGIVFLFLNSWRSTVITGLTLPISIIGTFFFMYAFGFSLNMITLMALSLCVGFLIDDAIVVRENIVRHLQMGKPAMQAALDGTREIGLAVLSTTLSVVAVFLPIGFMGGTIGKFFHEFGITIVVAVLISMLVSFTLDPMLSSIWHDPAVRALGPDGKSEPATNRANRWYARSMGRVTAAFDRFTEQLAQGYQRMLAWALDHPRTTVMAALGTLMVSFALTPLLGSEFVPKADFSETTVTFYTPPGTALEATEERARTVDERIRQMPEVLYTLTTINTGFAQGRNQVSVYIKLKARKDRTRSVDQLSAPMRQMLQGIGGITVTHVGVLDAVGGQKPVQLSVQGPDMQTLQRLTDQLKLQLQQVPGLVDLDSSLKLPRPTIDVAIDRDAAADRGLTVESISRTLDVLMGGRVAGTWLADDDQSYDIRVSVAPQSRQDLSDLGNTPLLVAGGMRADGTPSSESNAVRLSQVARLTDALAPVQINRRDLSREVELTANLSGRTVGEASQDIQKILDATPWPPGYRSRFGGSAKDMKESFSYAVSALILGVIFIYMILASQFRSFLQPLALMSSLPLTLIGVVLMLLVFGSSMSMFTAIGIIMLMGLVTKNAILLLDFANRARRGLGGEHGINEPLNTRDALLMAARVRLRPILMTSLAMVFGMVPLAFGLAEGAEQRAPMGQAVIGGVVASSILTLVVVPVIYVYTDRLGQWIQKRWWSDPVVKP